MEQKSVSTRTLSCSYIFQDPNKVSTSARWKEKVSSHELITKETKDIIINLFKPNVTIKITIIAK